MGPKTEPWGTPTFISLTKELNPPIETNCFLFDKYEFRNELIWPLNPKILSFSVKISTLTRSKAFLRSKNKATV